MSIIIGVPVSYKTLREFTHLDQEGVHIVERLRPAASKDFAGLVIAVNDYRIPYKEVSVALDPFIKANQHLRVFVIDGGEEANPYAARNRILDWIKNRGYDVHGVFFTDFDCTLHFDPFRLAKVIGLCGGRVTTKIPDKETQHFVKMQGMEVYDGFTMPGSLLGACLFMSPDAVRLLQHFDESNVSGGDAELAARWASMGHEVKTYDWMHVEKTVYGMTLHGIMDKQCRRGAMMDKTWLTSFPQLLKEISSSLPELGIAVSVMHSKGSMTSDGVYALGRDDVDPESYKTFLDKLFKSMFLLGQLANHMDER
jgi:hypothetical protein